MKQLLWILISIVVFIDIGYSQTVLPKARWRDNSGYQYLSLNPSDSTLRVSGTFSMSPDSTKERRWIMIDNWSSMPAISATVTPDTTKRTPIKQFTEDTLNVRLGYSTKQIGTIILDSATQRKQLYASVNNFPTGFTDLSIPTTFGTMTNLNITATTPTVLPSGGVCKYVTVVVDLAETDTIYVGGSGVTNANGIPLTSGDSMRLPTTNTNTVYVYSSPGAGRIRYYWEN